MFVWTGEVVISVILAAVAVIFYIISGSFTAPINPVDIGPAAFPRLMAIATILLAAGQVFLSVRKNKAPDAEKASFGCWQGCLAGLALMCVYAFLMPRLGYYVVTPFFIFAVMFLMGNRKWIQMILVTLGFTLFAFLVFTKLLGVLLP